ncbi:hypothetical protein C2G38_2192293 [Gigaspora rosea]|uniref:Uncharacterized protein n=1 Tax=Gigaspora rosea TaxID=44941 RepID=A0A397UZA1_9GLOM|nr:hypothetical protein C2G38_2192293 [Gigaspora rosea]
MNRLYEDKSSLSLVVFVIKSATGTSLDGRVAELQAVFSIQGKVTNVEKSESGKF